MRHLISIREFRGFVREIIKRTYLSVAALMICTVVVAADQAKCVKDDPGFIDKREGSQNGNPIQFNFESRVEKYTNIARRYTWCIENTSRYLVGEFRWGTEPNVDKDSRYFNAFVEPGKATPFVRTDSSGVLTALRHLGVRALNSTSWNTITTETIFNSHIGEKEESNRFSRDSLIRRIQFLADSDPTPIDILELSRDPKALAALLKNGKIIFEDSAIATIPTSLDTLMAINNGKYEKYSAKDFVRARMRLENYFLLSGGEPVSEIYLSIFPETADDSSRLSEALVAINALLALQPVQTEPYPKQLGILDEAKVGGRLVLRQSATELNYVSATLALGSKMSKASLATLPVRLLVGR